MHGIILFDGVCNFCNFGVQFIIKRDPKGYYSFASLQHEVGRKLREQHQIPESIDSLILIEGGQYYVKSSAVLRICQKLSGWWKVFYLFLLIPTPIRDMIYSFIARNRYQWFGKKDSCIIPTEGIRKRFLHM